eukprot:3699935-Rhodomonas_salina.4
MIHAIVSSPVGRYEILKSIPRLVGIPSSSRNSYESMGLAPIFYDPGSFIVWPSSSRADNDQSGVELPFREI